ncbi:MAG: ice-binding family protein [Clostridiales bacterium]|nr:ice-binding family protein [Clostridiales bacterium]
MNEFMKTLSKMRFIPLLLILLLVVMMVVPTMSMAAQPTVNLGTTSSFAVLAGSTITNTGPTTINGDVGGNVGLHPGTEFPGQADVTMTGWTAYLSDPAGVALQAKNDLVAAYLDVAGRTPTTTFTATDNQLGGQTLKSGVYAFGHADTANLTAASPLILDAEGNEDAVFIFQASSDLITASGSEIILINGARFCRVFWQVTSSATLGTNSHFVGHIFALTSITANTGATVQGQLLARNGAVTLDTNIITNGICAITQVPTATLTPVLATTPTPVPTATLAPVPAATPMGSLPKTSGFPVEILYTLGAGSIVAGALMKRNSK